MKVNTRRMMGVVVALAVLSATAARATIILQDNFSGSGEPSNVWIQAEVNGGTVALDGSGFVAATIDGATFEVAGFDARSVATAPVATNFLRLTFAITNTAGKPVSLYMGLDTGPGAPSGQGITLDHQAGSNWRVEIGGGLWTTPITQASGIDGTWQIDWYTSKVLMRNNGALVFDSTVTGPDVGSWTIPTGPAFPNFVAYGNLATSFKLDSVTFESLPEPSTISLLGMGVWLLRSRSKMRRLRRAS